MPKFPKKEVNIAALATQMIAGYGAHSGDFPSIFGPGLAFKKRDFEAARDAQVQAQAAAQLATEEKLYRLNRLKEEMNNRLKKSAVDVAGDPEKLAYIGWGPKTAAQMIEAPSAPMNLRAKLQGKGTILLLWENPSSDGAVRNYIIQRRQQLAAGDDLNVWSIAGSALKTEINLTGQPRGVQLEYRIKAANTGGESAPSNTSAVVL